MSNDIVSVSIPELSPPPSARISANSAGGTSMQTAARLLPRVPLGGNAGTRRTHAATLDLKLLLRAPVAELAVSPWDFDGHDAVLESGAGDAPAADAKDDAAPAALLPPVAPRSPGKKGARLPSASSASTRGGGVVVATYLEHGGGENPLCRPLAEYSQTLHLLDNGGAGAGPTWNPDESISANLQKCARPLRPETAVAKDFLRAFLVARGESDEEFRPSTATAKAHYSNFLSSTLDNRIFKAHTSLLELTLSKTSSIKPHDLPFILPSKPPTPAPSNRRRVVTANCAKNNIVDNSAFAQRGFCGDFFLHRREQSSRISLSHTPRPRLTSLSAASPHGPARSSSGTLTDSRDLLLAKNAARRLAQLTHDVDGAADIHGGAGTGAVVEGVAATAPLPALMSKYINRKLKHVRCRVTHGVPRKPPPARRLGAASIPPAPAPAPAPAHAPAAAVPLREAAAAAAAAAAPRPRRVSKKPPPTRPATVPAPAAPAKKAAQHLMAKGSALAASRPGTQQHHQQHQQHQQQLTQKQQKKSPTRLHAKLLDPKTGGRSPAQNSMPSEHVARDSWAAFQDCVEKAHAIGTGRTSGGGGGGGNAPPGKNQMHLLDVAELVNQLWKHCKRRQKAIVTAAVEKASARAGE